MFIVPLSNLVLALGMLTVGISYCSSWLASVYADATWLLTSILLKSVHWFGNLPISYIDSRFTLLSSAAFYGVVGFVMNVGRREIRKYYVLGWLAAANYFLYLGILQGPSDPRMCVTFLDVGQGDAIFIEYPGGRNLL